MDQPTWVRNPQNAEDEHDWTRWFDDPTKYRGCRFDPITGWTGPVEQLARIRELHLIQEGLADVAGS